MNSDKYTIHLDRTIFNTLEHMNAQGIKFIIVTNPDGVVVGTLTDGDIRRGIVSKIDLNSPISTIMNPTFKYVSESSSFNEVIEIFHEKKFSFIPVLDSNGKLLNLITRHTINVLLLMSKPMSFDYDFDELESIVIEHEIFVRPWGYYKTMVLNSTFQSKIIHLNPGHCLSLQSHQHREEYWTIISGSGSIQLDDSKHPVHPGEMFFIPKGCKHRLTNTGTETLIFSEVQLGDYFGEDDICRFDDQYGRS